MGAGPPTDPEGLRQQACLIYTLSDAPTTWSFARGTETRTVPVSGRFATNSSLAIATAAEADLGIARVPRAVVERALVAGRLVQVLPDWTVTPGSVWALSPAHREVSRNIRLFVDHLAAHLPRGA